MKYSFSLLIIVLPILWSIPAFSQVKQQVIKGYVRDADSGKPMEGVNITVTASNIQGGTITDSLGFFTLKIPVGRVELTASHVGYFNKKTGTMQVGAGKEAIIHIDLEEMSYHTDEINIKDNERKWLTPMSGASVKKLQSEDAARFAGGYFDPLRMASNLAGITSGNSDESNEIVIRGNSPRYLQWKLEGLVIPNPNHLANGQASSSGAYSGISTNALSNFDFYSGSFPAEYSDALSGVMDVYLREGNRGKHEKSVQLSVVGAELAMEGPLGREKNNNYLLTLRYANFNFLKYLNVIDPGDLSIVPSSFDFALKNCFHTTNRGTFEVFGLATQSKAGDSPGKSVEELKKGDNEDFLEHDGIIVTGIKNSFYLKNGKSFLVSMVGYTYAHERWDEGYTDTMFVHTAVENENFRTSNLTFSSIISHKISSEVFMKAGAEFRHTFARMYSDRYVGNGLTDTLLNNKGNAAYYRFFSSIKWKPFPQIEVTPGINLAYSGLTSELITEPRVGIHLILPRNQSISFGTGLFSCAEPMPIYFYRVKINNQRIVANQNLEQARAFHLTFGYRKVFAYSIHFTAEAYWQSLFHVPVGVGTTSQYSILNSLQGLPDRPLVNNGKGKNNGLEITIDKGFTRGYYYLATISLFDSKYLAPNSSWYPTYFNSKFSTTLVAGKEFNIGKNKQDTFALNVRNMYRGGYRYTPVNENKSHEKKRIVYDTDNTYEAQLPNFHRIDFGLSYKLNTNKTGYLFALDVQNLLNRHNVYRYNFSYSNKTILRTEKRGIGIVPLFSARIEF